jgi:hypothetical protein
MKTSILAAAIVTCALSAPLVTAQELSAPVGPTMGGPQGDPCMMGGPKLDQGLSDCKARLTYTDKDVVVRRILSAHYQPGSVDGRPSCLTSSIWSAQPGGLCSSSTRTSILL